MKRVFMTEREMGRKRRRRSRREGEKKIDLFALSPPGCYLQEELSKCMDQFMISRTQGFGGNIPGRRARERGNLRNGCIGAPNVNDIR